MSAGVRIEIAGTVQGVGFRPWVYRIAHEIGVGGRVHNHARGVTIEAFGEPTELAVLVARLREPPAPARVVKLETEVIAPEPLGDFTIVHSVVGGPRTLSIPPELATCADCERELFDPDDRRYHYPFTNCTACGPRFTIATGVPYDRPATTMAPFVMCAECQREYDDPLDRRFHAQPNACPICGPQVALWTPDGDQIASVDPIRDLATLIANGAIAAVKGLGGFHLACDATRGDVIATLRRRKHREQKPFAVMVASLALAEQLALLTDADRALLVAAERPIVLVPRRGATIADEVAPGTDLIGLMLPYTPLHHLLLRAVDRPLVMTSANPSEEPICADNAEAVRRLGSIADVLLVHDREIATRCDDSVARVIADRPTLIRRSRGYVPRPIALTRSVDRAVLAVGAQLKNTFCVVTGDRAYLGPHIGDLDNPAAFAFFESAIGRMEDILRVRPDVIAHDLHPSYLSTQYARDRAECVHVGVQHHHAHVASAMAEHGLDGPVIGVAYDGTGWGPDGTAWGGEILLADYASYRRLATFRPVPLAGGDMAIKEPWRVALALVDDAYGHPAQLRELAVFAHITPRAIAVVRGMINAGINAPLARGVGRFFDGIGALGLARTHAAYEGELAVAWNNEAAGDEAPYPFAITNGEIDLRPLVRAVVDDLALCVTPATISARFHAALVAATIDRVRAAVASIGALPVVLTGGAFYNPILAEGIRRGLPELDVRLHGEVPPGDGGIALGQALVADAQLRRHA